MPEPAKKIVIEGRTYYPEATAADVWWTIRNARIGWPGSRQTVALFPGATDAVAAEEGGRGPTTEIVGLSSELGDPAEEPAGWSPMSWVAQQANAAAAALGEVGARITRAVTDAAGAIVREQGLGTFAEAPGVTPGFAEPLARGLAAAVGPVARAVERVGGFGPEVEVAGYITLEDGTRIAVPKARDTQAAGERAQTDRIAAALNRGSYDLAIQRSKEGIERAKLATSSDQWERLFALQQRKAALDETAAQQAIRARELALEEATSSPAQRALWGRPSTLEKEPPSRRIRAIGAGGIAWG